MIQYTQIEVEIGKLLTEQGLTLSVAESCTGGLVSDLLTNVSGSSTYFLGGVIAYDNNIKRHVLGVSSEIIETYGAVSRETAEEMAIRVRELFHTNIGLSITGIAGPTGGSAEKPVGLVHIGLRDAKKTLVKTYYWKGSRIENKKQSAFAALNLVKEYIKTSPINQTG